MGSLYSNASKMRELVSGRTGTRTRSLNPSTIFSKFNSATIYRTIIITLWATSKEGELTKDHLNSWEATKKEKYAHI